MDMFEYNVKKSSEDRKEFKATLAAAQENYAKSLEACKAEISNLKEQLSESKRSLEIETMRKVNCEETIARERAELTQTRALNIKLKEEVDSLKAKC